AAELAVLLISGYLIPGLLPLTLVAISAGCCALLATRGFTRWRLAMVLVGYTTTSTMFISPVVFGALHLPLAPLLLFVAVAIAFRLRAAFPLSLVVCVAIVVEQIRAIDAFTRLGPPIFIAHAVVTALAAIGFTILAARG